MNQIIENQRLHRKSKMSKLLREVIKNLSRFQRKSRQSIKKMTKSKRNLEILMCKPRTKRMRTRKIMKREHRLKNMTGLLILVTLGTLQSKLLKLMEDLVTLETTLTLNHIQRLKIQDLEISMKSKLTNSKSQPKSERHRRILQPQKYLSQAKKIN